MRKQIQVLPLLPQIALLDPSEGKHFKKKGNVDFSG